VKTLTGTSLSLDVSLTDTVSDVKQRVQASHLGLRADRQHLTFAGKQLDDSRALSEYNVQQGSTLHLVLATQTGVDTTQEASPLMFYVAETPHGPIVFDGPPKDMHIFVGTKAGRRWSFAMSSHSLVAHLMHEIEVKAGVPVEQQHLSFRGHPLVLEEAATPELSAGRSLRAEAPASDVVLSTLFVPLSQHGVREGDTVDLDTDGRHVSIRTRAGRKFDVYVSRSDRVADVMARIQARWSMPSPRQCLRFQGRSLNPSTASLTRPFFEIVEEARRIPGANGEGVTLELSTCGQRVSIKPAWGKPFFLHVAPYDRVLDVMVRIQVLHGIPADQQRLSFNGKLLSQALALQNPFLSASGVSDGDTVDLAKSAFGLV